MPTQKIGEIKIHTAPDGNIWFAERGHQPRLAELDAEDFATQSWVLEADALRLLATRDNCDLICALHAARCGTGLPRQVLLGNPRILPVEYERLGKVFGRMERCDISPSLGGWRELASKDYVTYALAGVLKKSEGFNNLAERLLREHPVWPALSFLSDINKESACELICTMLDPRWWVDPSKPDARKRLNSSFGLGQDGRQNLAHIIMGGPENPPGRYCDRARLVLDTWTGGEYVPPAESRLDANSFLWRIQAKKAKTAMHSMQRACHVFLSFMRSVWLDNLTDERQYEAVTRKLGKAKKQVSWTYMKMVKSERYSPQLFVPEHFFELSTEVSAWNKHKEALKQRAI